MIKTHGLRKSFRTRRGSVEAVRGVDLDVQEGEVFGFLGPNGAGKTTTLRMLATLVRPDAGEASVAGADLLRQPAEVRRRIGYVAQGGGTGGEVTAREELVLQARLFGMSKPQAERRAEEAIAAFQLEAFADRRYQTYSGGQRRRLDIALSMVHRPRLVFLDEPTTGLDPQSRTHLWDEVRRLRDEGTTVFLTTHYLEEADALCDRVAIIDHGQIVVEGSPSQLKSEISGDVITLGVDGSPDATQAVVAGQPYVRKMEKLDGGLRLYADHGATALPRLLRALADDRIELLSIELHSPSLDDVFLAKTGRSLREDTEQDGEARQ